MAVRMNKTLRFLVDCTYQDRRHHNTGCSETEVIAEILREYERSSDAMRYLNAKGQIAWKASPRMLGKLADAERDAEDDLANCP